METSESIEEVKGEIDANTQAIEGKKNVEALAQWLRSSPIPNNKSTLYDTSKDRY